MRFGLANREISLDSDSPQQLMRKKGKNENSTDLGDVLSMFN